MKEAPNPNPNPRKEMPCHLAIHLIWFHSLQWSFCDVRGKCFKYFTIYAPNFVTRRKSLDYLYCFRWNHFIREFQAKYEQHGIFHEVHKVITTQPDLQCILTFHLEASNPFLRPWLLYGRPSRQSHRRFPGVTQRVRLLLGSWSWSC